MLGKFSLCTIVCALALSANVTFAETVTIDLWGRADKSGTLRPSNIIAAADTLNKMLIAAGSEQQIKVNYIETTAENFDADAINLLRAHSVGDTPDIAIAAHEWIGAFAEAGMIANLEKHITDNEAFYGDIIQSLWRSVSYKGERYGVPQDSEVRMFFLNNDILRDMGKEQSFIDALPSKVNSGEFTMYNLCDLASEAVSSGAAEYGIVHRPGVGPDFQMAMASFGVDIYDEKEAKLQITKSGLNKFYDWLGYCVGKKAIPADITSWSWAAVHDAFRGGKALSKHHGIWNVGAQLEAFKLENNTEAYFNKITWINAPAGEKGGKPSNLSHPIVYVVGNTKNKELASMLVALASQPIANTKHAISTNHTPINYGQVSMPAFQDKGWALAAGTPMLEYAQFMPNHPSIGQFNALIFQGIQAVETGDMKPAEAVEFVLDEMSAELGDDVNFLD